MKIRSRLLASLALSSCAILFTGCEFVVSDTEGGSGWFDGPSVSGSGVIKSETRVVSDFTRIQVSGSPDVTVEVGGAASVTLTGDDNLLPYVTTDVSEGELRIGMKPGRYSFHRGLKLRVCTPSLEAITVNGSSDIGIRGLSGARFSAAINGSGDIRASGRVDSVDVHVSGSGDCDLEGLEARDGTISIHGSGDAKVFATARLDVSVSGSGDVRYKGDPKVTKQIHGSGDVRRE